jgi:hypothetical protein
MTHMKHAMSKRDLMKLEQAACLIEDAAGNAGAALWYLEQDAHKGRSWGHAARRQATEALALLDQLFPDDD